MLSILLLCGIGYAHAQDAYERKLRFGLKAGVNGSLFTKTVEPFGPEQSGRLDYFNRFFRISGFGGLTVDAAVSKRLSVGVEALYNARGMAYREKNNHVILYDSEGNERQAFNDFNYNIDYIEFPLTLNYNFSDTEARTFIAGYAGVAPALAVHAITKMSYAESVDGSGRRARNERANLNEVNHFNNSLLLGLKVGDNNPRKTSVFGDFRMSYTLLPVFKKDEALSKNNLRTEMLTFSLGLGFKF